MVDYLVLKVVERLDHFVGLKECGEEGYNEFYTESEIMWWLQGLADRDWDDSKLNDFTKLVLSEIQDGSNPVSSSTSISSPSNQSNANNDSRTLSIGVTIDSMSKKPKYTSLKPIHPFFCALWLSIFEIYQVIPILLFSFTATYSPFFCALRLSIFERYQVIPLLVFSFAATYSIFTKYRKRRLQSIIVEDLTQKVINLLIKQSHIYESHSSSSSSSNQYPSIGISQLRDHLMPPTTKAYLLVTPFNSRSKSSKPAHTVSVPLTVHDRLEIWRKVSKNVLLNSSIRETVVNYKGEAMQMWEWIGPKVFEIEKVGQVDDSRRK